jgi:hypothetical protein
MKNYHLISYIEKASQSIVPKRVLTSSRIEPTHFWAGMNKLAYPIAISSLTKNQFNNMREAFPDIEVIE